LCKAALFMIFVGTLGTIRQLADCPLCQLSLGCWQRSQFFSTRSERSKFEHIGKRIDFGRTYSTAIVRLPGCGSIRRLAAHFLASSRRLGHYWMVHSASLWRLGAYPTRTHERLRTAGRRVPDNGVYSEPARCGGSPHSWLLKRSAGQRA